MLLQELFDRYKKVDKVKKGGQKIVYRVETDNCVLILKIICCANDPRVLQEIELTRKIELPFVPLIKASGTAFDSDQGEAVKRNIERFPERFMFQITDEEVNNLRSQIVTSSSNDNYGGRRYNPYVFTEQGIAMLSGVLRSNVAIEVSICIMDALVEMRRFISSNSMLFEKISKIELKQLEHQKETDQKFDQVFEYISEHREVKEKIFYKGQIYDAFSLITELIKSARNKIILIDNYVDIVTLNLLSKKQFGVEVIVYTSGKTSLSRTDTLIFNNQYPTLEIKHDDSFHDRFLILDDKKAYHIGASIKDAGKKSFAITVLEDEALVKNLLGILI